MASKKHGAPAKDSSTPALQTNLFAFFSSSIPVPPKKRKPNPEDPSIGSKGKPATDDSMKSSPTISLTPQPVPPPRHAVWQSLHDHHVIIRRPTNDPARTKVAAIDLDGTILLWTTPSWPTSCQHYRLWSSQVFSKLQTLYDEGHKLLIVSNQGAVRTAHQGKKAQLFRTVVDWIAHHVDRPLYAVCSTHSLKASPTRSYHKPSAKMWQVAIQSLNQGLAFDLATSFYVGDSEDLQDAQGGVDRRFAQAVSDEAAAAQGKTDTTSTATTTAVAVTKASGSDATTTSNMGSGKSNQLRFWTPEEFWGPSDSPQAHQRLESGKLLSPPPNHALYTRLALLGGYELETTTTSTSDASRTPILLLLAGVQGSGKSTFAQTLLDENMALLGDSAAPSWVLLSQDTIQNGKPGRREDVERRAKAELKLGRSVVVDRMHLDTLQRSFFVQLGISQEVPVHIVALTPPAEVIRKRVRHRTDHPGGVQGDRGETLALQSIQRWKAPEYSENFDLITHVSKPHVAQQLARLYASFGTTATNGFGSNVSQYLKGHENVWAWRISDDLVLPPILLGTMKLGKKVAKETVELALSVGFPGVDTAMSYQNLDLVGSGLLPSSFVIAKIPMGATEPQQVREELTRCLQALKRDSVDLLLLHWPHAVLQAGRLGDVWKEMEACYKEGLCRGLGVCNFNIPALAELLTLCTVAPSVNQVERHPLLPQLPLVNFCWQHGIRLLAHTPLGQGHDELLGHEKVRNVAKETSMTPAQFYNGIYNKGLRSSRNAGARTTCLRFSPASHFHRIT
eukprot:Nitzschia sp. Nitz4//scaffold46_size129759//42530//44906//NITZ4_003496-RA/size129759-snap-gene-0.23-mRNA-1//-1//CDS//3329552580//1295//frame0